MPGKSNQFENQCFLYLRETKNWWCEGEEGEEKVSLLTHATTLASVGKNQYTHFGRSVF